MNREFRATSAWPYHVCAGGTPYRGTPTGREYAVLVRHASTRGSEFESWHLPKGTVVRNETLEDAARREILEESGLHCDIDAYLGCIQARFRHPVKGIEVDRAVHYFLTPWDGSPPGAMDHEHDAILWLPPSEAAALLDRLPKSEGEIIRRAERWLAMNG